VASEVGEVSLLFNVAGIIDSMSPSRLDHRMWDYLMGINLAGVYHGIHTFAPAMIASERRAHIVNVASEAGLVEAGSGFLYHASKSAVLAMSESLRRELDHMNVGVSVLFPGPVATDIVQNAREARPDAVAAHSARVTNILDSAHEHLNRVGANPDAVGELVLDAVERDVLYVATRNEIGELLAERNRAVLAAMQYAETFLSEYEDVVEAR
jgi:NAD(P)-dependent dehydrogenase (short-subunit alcohol dehydrogenase family)